MHFDFTRVILLHSDHGHVSVVFFLSFADRASQYIYLSN